MCRHDVTGHQPKFHEEHSQPSLTCLDCGTLLALEGEVRWLLTQADYRWRSEEHRYVPVRTSSDCTDDSAPALWRYLSDTARARVVDIVRLAPTSNGELATAWGVATGKEAYHYLSRHLTDFYSRTDDQRIVPTHRAIIVTRPARTNLLTETVECPKCGCRTTRNQFVDDSEYPEPGEHVRCPSCSAAIRTSRLRDETGELV